MYSKHNYDFFQTKDRKTPRKKTRMSDREIPLRAKDSNTSELQSAKLSGSFKSPSDLQHSSHDEYEYASALCPALWNMPYEDMYKDRLLSLSIPPHYKPKPSVEKATFTPVAEQYINVSGLPKDYYLNPLCWADKTEICIGLNDTMFIYNLKTHKANYYIGSSAITALAYNSGGSNAGIYAIAGLDGKVHYIDSGVLAEIRLTHGIGACTKIVSDGAHGFYAASKYSHSLTHIDLRNPPRSHPVHIFENYIAGFTFGQQNDVGTLAISNGTTVEIYDPSYLNHPRLIFKEHRSPSKALAFSPNNKYIASGGGTDDQSLKIWNPESGKIISQATTTYAQVCNVHWLDEQNIFITEGYNSGVSCWTINGRQLRKSGSSSDPHKDRVLYSAQDPAAPQKIVTASPDQILSFWSVRKKSAASKAEIPGIPGIPDSFLSGNRIR